MDAINLSSVIQGSLSVIGFLAVSFWLMKWAKGLHERGKELGEIDKEIRAVLKDSIAAQKDLHRIERQKLELQLEKLNSDIEKKQEELEVEKRVLEAAIKALDVADVIAREVFWSRISEEYGDSRQQFLQLIELLDSNGIIKKETFYALDTFSPLPKGATVEQEMAWRLTVMHDARTTMSVYAESILVLAPTAVSFAVRNPKFSKQEIVHELSKKLHDMRSSKLKGAG